MTQRSASSPRTEWYQLEGRLLPLLVTLLALAVSLYRLDGQSLWFDELATLTGAGWGGSWLDAIQKPLAIPTTPKPPLSYLVTHLFLLLGERDLILRLPAAFFATLTVPLTYSLGRTLFGRQVALLAAFLLAVAPLQIRYAQEARMYAMWSFLVLLSLYLFWRAVRSRQGRSWVLFAVVTVLALYTHHFTVLALAVMALFALWVLIRPATRARFPFRTGHLLITLGAIFLAYVPMVPFLLAGLLGAEGFGGEAVPRWGLGTLLDALALFSAGNQLGSWVYGSLFVLAAVLLARKDREILALAVLWVALPFIIVLSLPFGHTAFIRYFLFALPVYLLLVAYGLRAVAQWFASIVRRLRPTADRRLARGLIGLTLAALLAAIGLPSIRAYHVETKQNWRDATRLVCTLAGPGDQIFVEHVYHQVGVLYYARQYCPDAAWTESNVLVEIDNLASALSPDAGPRHWLIARNRDEFLPGAALDVSLQPAYHLQPAIVFPPSQRPKGWGIVAPVAFRGVAVIPVEASIPGSIQFWAEPQTLAPGDCAQLHWQVDDVRAVYLDGEGVVGHDQRQVCPSDTTNYELKVVRLDGTETVREVQVSVASP